MSISDIVEKCSDVFLHFDYTLGAAYVCFSVVLEALRFGEELGGFVRLEGLESIHSQSKLLYQRGSKLKAKQRPSIRGKISDGQMYGRLCMNLWEPHCYCDQCACKIVFKKQTCLQLIMQARTNQLPARPKPLTSSTLFFSKTSKADYYNPKAQSFAPSTAGFQVTQPYDQPQRQPFSQTMNTTSQSLIFQSPRQSVAVSSGFGKLESMARHVPHVSEETHSNSSISQNESWKPSASKKQGNPFSSQIFMPKSSQSSALSFQGDPTRRRRESVGLETIQRGANPQQNLKMFQRMGRQVEGSTLNTVKDEKNWSDLSASSDLAKFQRFDFLKKRKDGTSNGETQSLKQFQHMKRSEIVSPPSEGRPVLSRFHHGEAASTSKAEDRGLLVEQALSPTTPMEFKKKKFCPPSCLKVEQSATVAPLAELRPQSPMQELIIRKSKGKKLREITIDDFQLMDKLGKGAFGEVFVAQEKQLGFICVIKKMSKKKIRQLKMEEHITREIKLQSFLNHSHCTSLYGYFHDQDHLYLIMELLPDGSLQQVKKKRKLPEKETIEIVKQVAEGLKYLHEESVIHRDLKPENLFMNQGYVKLGDFGCSIYHNQIGLRNTIVGCLEYSSPQQLKQQGYTNKIDSWSLGILTFELLFGKSPFESDIKKMVCSSDTQQELPQINFPSQPVIGEAAKDFILNLLSADASRRMDMDEVLFHRFLK